MAAIIFVILAIIFAVYGTAVFMVGSGTLFFMVWYVLAALAAIAAWLAYSGVGHQAPAPLKATVYVLGCIVLAAIIISSAFVVSGMDSKTKRADYDYLVVLGAQVYSDSPSAVLQYRLDEAYRYLMLHPATQVIVCGGQGYNEPLPEARVMASYLEARGITKDRIIIEDTSLSTKENLTNAQKLVPGLADKAIGIVTNNFHVFRSTLLAKNLGFSNAQGVPAYSTPFYLPNNVFRESLALIKMVLIP
ncbi:MAG: YdcF family protein [Coriobacteriales bacterium]|nr:YdcF family protein [Coriobacteriales bacterium]